MSFTDDYNAQKKKRKEKEKERIAATSKTDFEKEYFTAAVDREPVEDIAPVKTTTKKEKERTWFQKGAFEDGYQFGDVTKTVYGSIGDLRENIAAGILGMGEKAVDTGAYLIGGAADLIGADKFADTMKDFIAKDLYDEKKLARLTSQSIVDRILYSDKNDPIYKRIIQGGEYDSFFGDKTDSLAQSGGELLGTIGLQAVGVPWFVTTGVTSFGSEVENAFNQDATYGQAGLSAAITAGAEILTEKISSGISFGSGTLDDVLTKKLATSISNKAVRSLAKAGVDIVGEGSEEVISQFFSNLGSSLYREENIKDILFSEEAADEYLESFIGGAALGGVGSVSKTIGAKAKGVDATSGLTENEEKVFKKVYGDKIAEAEKDGEKLSEKEKSKIYDSILSDMEKGYINTDTIEEVLGGEDYSRYQNELKRQQDIDNELKELRNMKSGDMTDIQVERMAELKAMKPNTEMVKSLKFNVDEKIRNALSTKDGKGSRLLESYNERARRGQNFEADISKYDEKQKVVIQKAIDSGVLNNTNRTHEFVDFLSKMSADKGVLFDFLNNEKLKGTSFARDDAFVNGYYDKNSNTIGVNIDSAKAINSTVGHEITHVLEGTELYGELQNTLFEYAKTKGEYDSRREALAKLYAEEDIDSELAADLVGDYLFQDSDFINHLSVSNRNVFQKIYDEIKYLYKIATAGSKQARDLERVKRAFDKAYNESAKGAEGTKYSVSDNEGKALTKEQSEYFKDSKVRDDNGKLKVVYHGSPADFNEFSLKYLGTNGTNEGYGFYFTDSKRIAEGYSKGEGNSNGRLFETYLDIKKPLSDTEVTISRAQFKKLLIELNNQVDADGEKLDILSNYGDVEWEGLNKVLNYAIELEYDGNDNDVDIISSLVNSSGNLETVYRVLREVTGYDGIIVKEAEWGGDQTIYIAFHPEQIKNSDNLNPTDNPDIRFSLSENNEQTKIYGDWNIFGDDIRYKGNEVAVEETVEETVDEAETPTENIAPPIPETVAPKKRKPSRATLSRFTKKQTYSGGANLQGAYNADGKQYMSDGIFAAEFNAVDEKIPHNKDFPIDKLKQIIDNAVDGQSAEKYSIDLDKIIELNKANKGNKDNKVIVSVGGTPYDAKYIEAVMRAIPNSTFALSKHHGVNMLVAVGENGTATLMPLRAGENLKVAYEAQEIKAEVAPEGFAPTTEAEANAMSSEILDSLTDADAPPEIDAPYYGESDNATPSNPFTKRDYTKVGNPKTKSYISENPDALPFFKEAATAMLGDLQNSQKGEKWYNDRLYYESGGQEGIGGTRRETTADIADLLDGQYHYTYQQIENALNAIINNEPLNACAKRIEFALNDRLLNGYTDIDGNDIPANQDYINMLSRQQTQEVYQNNASSEVFTDADAPYVEEVQIEEPETPIAPVAEKYEAIRPQKQDAEASATEAEPRMKRVDSKNNAKQGEEERRWYGTSTSSEAVGGIVTPDDIPDDVRYYKVKPNKKTLETANARLARDGYAKSREYFEGRMSDKKLTVEDIALGERLIQEAAKAGDAKAVRDLIIDVSILGTELGQRVQALSIIRRLTPEGQLKALTRTVERGKAKGDKAFKDVEVTEEMTKTILETLNEDGTFDQAELNRAVEDVKQQIADQMPVSAMDYINAWRYLSMLGNPKTHIRNIVSNVAMFGTRQVKNVIARTAEDVFLHNQKPTLNTAETARKTATQSTMPNGTRVKAKDRDNIGVVRSYNAQTNKYTVYFENKAGHNATVQLDAKIIEPLIPIKEKNASGNDDIAPVNVRTKTWKKSSDAVKAFAEQTTKEMDDAINGDTKYSEEGGIKEKRNIFKTKAGNWMSDKNQGSLEAEDALFSRPAFRASLQEYLTANGIETEADIKNNPEIVEKAKDYALKEAREATFRQDSYFANKIREVENKNPFYGMVIGSVMPFKKTPINIAKTGIAYSPLGIARNIYDAVKVHKGEMDITEAIDHAAQTLTGTSLFALGVALASMGVLNGAGEDDKEGKYDYQLGEQSYSFNFGGDSYSLSWLSPVSMPLFVGVNAYEKLVEKEEWDMNVVFDTAAQTLDPLSEMSFLSSLDDVLSSYDSGMGKIMGAGESLLQNYITQFIPTLSSQVASTFDDTKRSTKASRDSEFKFGEETLKKVMYKVPGLRNMLEPTTDIWGNEYKQADNIAVRAFDSFLSPANRREDITSSVDKEIKRIYGQTGDTGVLPSIPYDYTSYDGVKYEMSAEEYTEYKKIYGQTAYDLMADLFKTDTYKNATSEERAEMINKVYDYARDEAKYEYFAGKGVDYTNATKDGVEYYKDNSIKGAIENDLPVDEYTFSVEFPKKYKFLQENGVAYERYRDAPEEFKEAYTWAYNNPDKFTMSKAVTDDVVEYRRLTGDLYDIKADKDSSGKSIVGSRKSKVAEFINNSDLDYGARLILFKSQYKADDTYNYEIISYLNQREDVSFDDMKTILEELGFKVDSKGNITWD